MRLATAPMVTRARRAVGPDGFRQMKASARRKIAGRTAHDDPRALMAPETEALAPVAARAARLFLTGHGRMQIQPVVGMHAARSDAAVVTVDAFALLMTARTKLAVRTGHVLVPFDPVRAVIGVVHPARREQLTTGKPGPEAPRRRRQMTGFTRARSVAAGRALFTVTAQAAPHAGQLVARRELEVLHRTVTLSATDVARRVCRVVELE